MSKHWSLILSEIRKEAGVTRAELSVLSGVASSTIENYERQIIKEPSIDKMESLLEALGYELDAIKSGDSDAPPPSAAPRQPK